MKMKRAFVILSIVAVAGLIWLAVELDTCTDPYVVKPTVILPAPSDTKIGHSFDATTHTLSVVSRNEVIVVADPGASFSYEVLWLWEVPPKGGSDRLMLYRVQLPEFSDDEHINPLGAKAPPKIAKFASGDKWR